VIIWSVVVCFIAVQNVPTCAAVNQSESKLVRSAKYRYYVNFTIVCLWQFYGCCNTIVPADVSGYILTHSWVINVAVFLGIITSKWHCCFILCHICFVGLCNKIHKEVQLSMRDRASATHYTGVYLNDYRHGGAFAPVSSSICVVIFTRCNNFQLRDLMAVLWGWELRLCSH